MLWYCNKKSGAIARLIMMPLLGISGYNALYVIEQLAMPKT